MSSSQASTPTTPDLLAVPDLLAAHLEDLQGALASLAAQAREIDEWGRRLARRLDGGRLLVAGNGGSAAEAQHLTAELVGRFQGERQPLSALALHAETSTLTAVLNDYGPDEVFARQVEAHGRPGDVLILMSTSGTSSNLLAAARRAVLLGIDVWALTGPAPNPLSELASRVIAIESASTSSIQECHLVAVHSVCAALEAHLPRRAGARSGHQDVRREVTVLQGGRDGARSTEVAS
jgi:phosphoheptose isomerase